MRKLLTSRFCGRNFHVNNSVWLQTNLAGRQYSNLSVVVHAVNLIDILEVIAIGRLKLFFGNRLLERKLPVALIRFVPADVDNPFLLVSVRVERLATDRIPFELVRSHSVVHGQLRLRGRGSRAESGCGQQRFFILHFGASAAAKACHEERKSADNFQAGEYVSYLLVSLVS